MAIQIHIRVRESDWDLEYELAELIAEKIESKIIENRYTKSKKIANVKEFVEIVIGTSSMPCNRWIDSFVIGYYTLALHDDRLAFFILHYLKRTYSIKIIDLIIYARKLSLEKNLLTLKKSFMKLEKTAREVQESGNSHLVEPEGFSGIPYDPPEGVFLELLMNRQEFYDEFLQVVKSYLSEKLIVLDQAALSDLFMFQNAAIAHPDGPPSEELYLNYNWIEYFAFAFNFKGSELRQGTYTYRVTDPKPSNGDPLLYLKNSFDVRGVPAFNEIRDDTGKVVFPLL